MLNINHPEITFALNAVRQASLLVKDIQLRLAQPALTKDDRSPVTIADFASQALVGKLFLENYPDIALVGEEDSAVLKEADQADTLEKIVSHLKEIYYSADAQQVCSWIDVGGAQPAEKFWTLDPIDGTKGFLRGEQYVTALAMVENGQVQIGVLGCPNLNTKGEPEIGGPGSLVVAQRGEGCWMLPLQGEAEPRRLGVSTRNDPAQTRLLRSFEAAHTNVSQLDHFADQLGVSVDPVRMDSQAKYVLLASGLGEMILRLLSPKRMDYKEKIWDQAAGLLILEEAGGRITDLDGKPLDFTQGRTLSQNRGVIASNGYLHEAGLKAIQELGI